MLSFLFYFVILAPGPPIVGKPESKVDPGSCACLQQAGPG